MKRPDFYFADHPLGSKEWLIGTKQLADYAGSRERTQVRAVADGPYVGDRAAVRDFSGVERQGVRPDRPSAHLPRHPAVAYLCLVRSLLVSRAS